MFFGRRLRDRLERGFGRFEKERDAIPAISLTTDSSIITSIGNDYSFDKIFERQCEALIESNDIIFVISTSGNSTNVINGVKVAKKKNIPSIGLLGNAADIYPPAAEPLKFGWVTLNAIIFLF